jgi:hypothetical protein
MESRFTEPQRRAIQELVGLPPKLSPDAASTRRSVTIREVREALGLPEPSHMEMVTDDSWLMGGAPMRWICGERLGDGGGDIDLFFPSAEALNRAGRALLAQGCTFRCFRAWKIMCQRCGRPGQVVRNEKGARPEPSYFPSIRCEVCGELGPEDYARTTAENLLPLTPELITGSGMLAAELATPSGQIIHLSAIVLKPTPQDFIAGVDFSVVQFLLTRDELHFGPYSWTDLLTDRCRVTCFTHPTHNYYRMRKYAAAGFQPYGSTRLRVTLRHLAHLPRQILKI